MSFNNIPPVDKQAEAEFNSALAFLERLNNEEFQIESCMVSGRLWEAFLFLETYESELFFCFTEKEKQEIVKIKTEINFYFSRYPGIGKRINMNGKIFIAHAEILPILRGKLLQLNRYIRGIKQQRGMGMPKRGEGKLF